MIMHERMGDCHFEPSFCLPSKFSIKATVQGENPTPSISVLAQQSGQGDWVMLYQLQAAPGKLATIFV